MSMLRPYQLDAANAVFDYFERGKPGNPLIVLPTGSGKSHVLAELARRVAGDHGCRVAVLAHRKELLVQNAEKLAEMEPGLSIGAFSAGIGRHDTRSDVLYCGIQSVYDKAATISPKGKPVEMVFVDECHLVPFDDGGMYRRLFSDLKAINPHLRIVGCTATPWRYRKGDKVMSGGYDDLTEGEGHTFDSVVYDGSKDIIKMIDAGHLSPLWPAKVGYAVDASWISIQNGDYRTDEADDLMSSEEVVSAICEDAVSRARADGRQHWLVFASGVKSAKAIFDKLRLLGVERVEIVSGSTPDAKRDAIVEAFKRGLLEAVISINVLGVGFDAPNADCLIFARLTDSPIIHVQFLGRGMRVTPEKLSLDEDGRKRGCLVLDYVGNTDRHGPIDAVRIKRPKEKKPPQLKVCPECKKEILALARVCPYCGFDFVRANDEKEPPKLSHKALILGFEYHDKKGRLATAPVSDVRYFPHVGKSGVASLRVDYYNGLHHLTSEWVCLNHPQGSYARNKAIKWFTFRVGKNSVPPNGVDEFFFWLGMGMKVAVPKSITVLNDPKGAYPEIVSYQWHQQKEGVAA